MVDKYSMIQYSVIYVNCNFLKVPKRENFSIAFFAQSEPIWICDVGTSKKIEFFSQLTLISMVFGSLPLTECAVNQKKI